MASFDEKREALRQKQMMTGKKLLKSALFLVAFLVFMALFMAPMGMTNAINTMMNTAYRILLDTVFYIMAIAVLAGALSPTTPPSWPSPRSSSTGGTSRRTRSRP